MPATMGSPRINLLRAKLGVCSAYLPDDAEHTALPPLAFAIMRPRSIQAIIERAVRAWKVCSRNLAQARQKTWMQNPSYVALQMIWLPAAHAETQA